MGLRPPCTNQLHQPIFGRCLLGGWGGMGWGKVQLHVVTIELYPTRPKSEIQAE